MLSSISPFGERARDSRWGLTAMAYLVGSSLGGATTGLAFGLAGQALDFAVSARTALALLAVGATLGVAADLRLFGLRVPSIRRQVNEDWLTTYRGWVYGLGFGLQLGLGLVTIIATSAVWLVWLAAALSGSWFQGLALGAIFGTARGSFIFVTAKVDEPVRLRELFGSIAKSAPAVHRGTIAATALTAFTALAGLAA